MLDIMRQGGRTMFYDALNRYDPEVFAPCERELRRQQHNIELIASENIVSEAVLCAAGTVFTNKYAEGYPGKRYYGGCVYADEVETIAKQRACRLFGAEHANVQPHSGANANLAAFFALLQPGAYDVASERLFELLCFDTCTSAPSLTDSIDLCGSCCKIRFRN